MKDLFSKLGAGAIGLFMLAAPLLVSSCQTLPKDAVPLYEAWQGNPKERGGYGMLVKEITSSFGVLDIYKTLVPVVGYPNSEDVINNVHTEVVKDEKGRPLYEEATRYVLFRPGRIIELLESNDGEVTIEEIPIKVKRKREGWNVTTTRIYGKPRMPDIVRQFEDKGLIEEILYSNLSKPRKEL